MIRDYIMAEGKSGSISIKGKDVVGSAHVKSQNEGGMSLKTVIGIDLVLMISGKPFSNLTIKSL